MSPPIPAEPLQQPMSHICDSLGDSLVRLPNRTTLISMLVPDFAKSQRLAALILVDIDRFRDFNIGLGQDIGDVMLCRMAETVRKCCNGDFVARSGDDEFAVLLGVDNPGEIYERMDALFRVLKQPVHVREHSLYLTVSMGYSFCNANSSDVRFLLQEAESALHQAKADGGNSCQGYRPDITGREFETVSLEARLRHALPARQFFLEYQPKVSLTTGAMSGVEALIRWNDSVAGRVPPDKFISLAERSGLIISIGEWVLRQACTQLRAWHNHGIRVPSVAVNLSARQLLQHDLVAMVNGVLAETSVPPHMLELEITENAMIRDVKGAAAKLNAIAATGVTFAIDDFGTGYSSLGYLRQLPAKTIKIDRSFIRGIPDEGDNVTITKATVGLAHALEMKVIAEGVETREQIDFLKSIACDDVQGHYTGKPMNPDAIESYMRTRGTGMRV